MGATNILHERSGKAVTRIARDAARKAFAEGTDRATELVEILHFAAWKAPADLQATNR